jgi:hypothetical protein
MDERNQDLNQEAGQNEAVNERVELSKEEYDKLISDQKRL